MKEKTLILAMVMCLWAETANAQAPRPLLGKSVTSQNATTDITVNAALNQAFILSGMVKNSGGLTPVGVLVTSTTNGSFSGFISSTTNSYRIALPAGTYTVDVALTNGPQGRTGFVYQETSAITVSGDMIHNVTVPSATTSTITGTVSNLIAGSIFPPSQTLSFSSTTVTGFFEVLTSVSLPTDGSGTFSVDLPNGMFSATLTQDNVSNPNTTFLNFSADFTTNPLGSYVVSGPATGVNFAAPTITMDHLTGTVAFTGSATLPVVELAAPDNGAKPLPTTISNGSGSPATSGATNGEFDFALIAGRTYNVSPSLPVTLFMPSTGSAIYTPPDPSPQALNSGGTARGTITYPAIPGPVTPVTISGQVTVAGSGAPVANASVDSTSSSLSGASNTSFSDFASTNTTGNYSLSVAPGNPYTVSFTPTARVVGDFTGNGRANLGIFRPTTGEWDIFDDLTNLPTTKLWGANGDIPVRGDFDGDGKTDIAVFRPSNGTWYIILSSNGSIVAKTWGTSGDIPVPGDYDGDGKTDFAVWRPSTGTWYVILSSNSSIVAKQWGTNNDIPVPGDYDGDGKTDFAVWRPSTGTWYVVQSSNSSIVAKQWGTNQDMPVQNDYDGDGKTDFGVFRPSTGFWYIVPSGNPTSTVAMQWGISGDIPVPADYEGLQFANVAVWRPSDGTWYIVSNLANIFANGNMATPWGISTDIPVQKPAGQ